MNELLPCPFCGAIPGQTKLSDMVPPTLTYSIGCHAGESCPASPVVYGDSQEDARKRWNQRHMPKPVVPPLAPRRAFKSFQWWHMPELAKSDTITLRSSPMPYVALRPEIKLSNNLQLVALHLNNVPIETCSVIGIEQILEITVSCIGRKTRSTFVRLLYEQEGA